MPAYSCPHCQKPFSAAGSASEARVLCPHCQQAVSVPKTPASRWYYARGKKKYGPYSWPQLRALAKRGDVGGEDMLLREGTKQWVRADSVPGLFEGVAAPGVVIAAGSAAPFPWMTAALAGACLLLVTALGVAGYFLLTGPAPADPPPEKKSPVAEVKKPDPPKPVIDPPKKDEKVEEKKPTVEVKPAPKPKPMPESATEFVSRLNRQRKHAGLAPVALDADLSRGCEAHAKYLAQHLGAPKANADDVHDQDPAKPGYSLEGQRAGQNAMIAFLDPLDALDRWMGRIYSRGSLLAPEMRSIGIGFAKNAKGDDICVVDPMRGRGEPIVVYPARNQTDVPLSFTSGPEIPDAKTVAGFPITVAFPTSKAVTDAKIDVRLRGKAPLDGWTWTPEKPVRPGGAYNAVGFVPKGLLQSGAAYEVRATAQVDGKPWQLAWSFTTEDDADTKGVWAKKAIAKVNVYRAQAGLKPVTLDEKLSRGCLGHARYLVINDGHPALEGLKAHDEDKSLPGFSEEGRAAGKASDIAIGDNEPLDGLDGWMATLYHRTPLLEPGLASVGFGCARGRRQGWVTVMNVSSGRGKSAHAEAVLYPAPNQTDVPLNFPNGGEEPNPIPEDKTGKAGYPITAFFTQGPTPKDAVGRLTDQQGAEVPCWFSSPEKLANPKFPQGPVICLIPKAPLKINTIFHVHFEGERAGKTWQQKWKFTTGEGGPSAAAATQMVLDRLNHYRATAGLNRVTLDEAQARGCQLHAEYLAKNADILIQRKAPVNNEDENLPGFTREGLRAALQSDVFSNAPIPTTQIDDLMATFTRRVYLLDPNLQRIGFGCYHDIGRGWRCVLDVNGGRGDSRIVVFPAPNQEDVPIIGFDAIADAKGDPGFPITVVFPRQTSLRNVQAVLSDAGDKDVPIVVSSPERPLNPKLQRSIIGVHPLAALRPGQTYSITISAIANGKEWRQTWRFTTSAR
ncbi:MAG: DUF4339 domain-containing protein [Planctomycetes bacterium]|nr:DUF4339 domain-containing protein [Planctomycetota bacterium]